MDELENMESVVVRIRSFLIMFIRRNFNKFVLCVSLLITISLIAEEALYDGYSDGESVVVAVSLTIIIVFVWRKLSRKFNL